MFDMDEASRAVFDQRHEKGVDFALISESSLDCSELQRVHAHQTKGTGDPHAVAQFDWAQEVVDRVLAWYMSQTGAGIGPLRWNEI
jgi:hypothetical protein